VTLRFTSDQPLEAHTLPISPLPHPSWSLIAATAEGWSAISTLVDPPLEGEAATLSGDRVWVAGAGAEGALWLYAFAFAEGKLTPQERLRLPVGNGARVAALAARDAELRIRVREAGGERAFALTRGF
jgi:hypothetical protein